MGDQLENALQRYFGFERFRAGQREVIEKILAARHTLAVLPTGLGKSLCYQLAAQMLPGVTLVISPLIALMQDQIDSLSERGFADATSITSALDPAEVGARLAGIERGRYRLIYVAPERFDSPRFQQIMRRLEVSLLVIDEAHCISQWGHDFRPHYRNLLDRLPELRQATVLAVTATATPDVQKEIVETLRLPSIRKVMGDLNRPNLRFESARADSREEKDARLLEMLDHNDGAAIIYASTRRESERVYRLLKEFGHTCTLYHAGLESEHRALSQREFQQGRSRIIVATVAFGMGIDKADIRSVIHYNIPASIENYYQEAGRAGRDGKRSLCALLYSQQDVQIQRFLLDGGYPDRQTVFRVFEILRETHPLPVSTGDLATAGRMPEIAVNASLQLLYEQGAVEMTQDGKHFARNSEARMPDIDFRCLIERRKHAEARLRKMIEYATAARCRRAQILDYFGQQYEPPCDDCDVCCKVERKSSAQIAEATPEADRVARVILEAAIEANGRVGRSLVADMLAGSRRKQILEMRFDRAKHFAALRLHGRERIAGWIREFIDSGLLETTADEYPRLRITSSGRAALEGDKLISLDGFSPERVEEQTEVKIEDTGAEKNLFERLRQWRLQKAQSLRIAPFMILHDGVMKEVARHQPRRVEELNRIKGIGEDKSARFGEDILSIINDASEPTRGQESLSMDDLFLQIEMWRQGGIAPHVEDLMAALENPSSLERGGLIVVIGALKDLPARKSAGKLISMLGETDDGNLIASICAALAQLATANEAKCLIALLDDPRAGVRRASARALGSLRVEDALDKLKVMADRDESQYARLAARAAALLIDLNLRGKQ